MLLKKLLLLNYRLYIVTMPEELTFEQYSVLQDVSKLDYNKEYRKYLAVMMRPLFGKWSIKSYESVEKYCGSVRIPFKY